MGVLRGVTSAVLAVLVGALLVVWMLGQLLVLGPAFPGMQLTFLAVGVLLVAVGLAGRRAGDEFRSPVRS